MPPKTNSRVGIRDVAARANVSVATVSRVLSESQATDTEKARRVLKAARELGYSGAGRASLDAQRLSLLVGVLVSDVRNTFFADVVRGIEGPLTAKGLSVVLLNSDEDPWKERQALDLIAKEHLAGAIVCPVSSGETDVEGLLAGGVPVVALDREVGAPVDTVLCDNYYGGFIATRHLLERGYSRVACVTGPSATTSGSKRLAGWKAAHTRMRREWPDWLVFEGDFREVSARIGATELLNREEPPDAFFVANNPMTIGVIDALQGAGLNIPEDVAIVGYDETPWAKILRPPLTVVAQAADEMGRIGGEFLLARLEGDQSPPRREMLPTYLLPGESSPRRTPNSNEPTPSR